ncbi:hypothetical protein MTO96_023501 [Rhipicephalus appendiculatus]
MAESPKNQETTTSVNRDVTLSDAPIFGAGALDDVAAATRTPPISSTGKWVTGGPLEMTLRTDTVHITEASSILHPDRQAPEKVFYTPEPRKGSPQTHRMVSMSLQDTLPASIFASKTTESEAPSSYFTDPDTDSRFTAPEKSSPDTPDADLNTHFPPPPENRPIDQPVQETPTGAPPITFAYNYSVGSYFRRDTAYRKGLLKRRGRD